jgi:ketosteroid isomerase-like protein
VIALKRRGKDVGIAENKQVVVDFYEAAGRGDMDQCFALLADDITWTNIGTTRLSGTYKGKQELVERLLGPLFSQLRAGIRSRIERLVGEEDIVVAQTAGIAETLDGRPYNNTYCQVIRLRDGQIIEVTEYLDTALVSRVFGDG